MWTFEHAPLDFFESEYGFRPDQAWLDHTRLAALRFGEGCSASFISPRGLILTNHHCARDHVGEVSPKDQDWLGDGFFAGSLNEEVPVPGLTVQQLVSMRDISAEINAGLAEASTDADRQELIKANRRSMLVKAKKADPEHTHQVVSLYQGGLYQLYSYKVYTDIRLVASPQLQCAKFGGDPDNFTFPRFSLDFAVLRAWENDQPADTKAHYFRVKTAGPSDGETVFVIGNPGSTGRLNTIAQMEFMRDRFYPPQLRMINRGLKNMYRRAEKRPEAAKQMRTRILMLENVRKAYQGFLDGLCNEQVMDVKRKAENEIRATIAADPELDKRFGDAWKQLEKICAEKQARDTEAERRKELEDEEKVVAKRIGEAFFAVYGTEIPPDATFTLRISDGVVKGFPSNGTVAPWFTSLFGLFARNTEFGNQAPFNLPENWLAALDNLDLRTPFNLVTTCDIIGGNSGSPMIDSQGNLVGLVFDGNIESLGNRFVFTDEIARTVCVHPAIIIEALRKIYSQGPLADEMEGKGDGYR